MTYPAVRRLIVTVSVWCLRAGDISLQLHTVSTAKIVAITDGGGVHIAAVVMSTGYFDSAPFMIVKGFSMTLLVRITVLFNVTVQTYSTLILAMLLWVE